MEVEMMILVVIVLLLILLGLTVLALLSYYGLFHEIKVGAGKPPIRNVEVAYKTGTGPYNSVGKLFCELARHRTTQREIGVYYDDPKQVPAHKLRFLAGLILAEGDEQPDESLKESLKADGYSFCSFPSLTHAVTTTFPHKGMLSIFMAVTRVYPKICEYVQEHQLCAHPMIEIYVGDTIHFMAPLSKQDEFYVPEVKEISESEGDDSENAEEDGGDVDRSETEKSSKSTDGSSSLERVETDGEKPLAQTEKSDQDAKEPEAEESSPEPRERNGERSRTPSPEDRTDDKGEKSDKSEASSFEDLGQEGADV